MPDSKENTQNNVFIDSLKALISFIPQPGKVYTLIHAMIIVQAIIVSMRALYMGSWAVLLLIITLPVIIISALCMTAKRAWLLAFLSSLIGIILFLWAAFVEEDIIQIWPLLIVYTYSALSSLSGWISKKGEYSLRTFNILKRKLPLGLFLLIIYAVFIIAYHIHFIWKISSIVMMNESNSLTANTTLSSFNFWLSTLIALLFIPIIYFIFNRKETPVLICLAITSAYLALNYIQKSLEHTHFLLQNLERIGLYLVIPLLFIYYIKTSKEAEAYFLPNSKNNETS